MKDNEKIAGLILSLNSPNIIYIGSSIQLHNPRRVVDSTHKKKYFAATFVIDGVLATKKFKHDKIYRIGDVALRFFITASHNRCIQIKAAKDVEISFSRLEYSSENIREGM